MDYAARKWPGITWLLDHMSYPYPPGDMSAGADLGKDNWAGYRPVLDLARHPNIMYASLPEGSGESGAALANLGTSLPAAAAVLLGQAPDADAANKTVPCCGSRLTLAVVARAG